MIGMSGRAGFCYSGIKHRVFGYALSWRSLLDNDLTTGIGTKKAFVLDMTLESARSWAASAARVSVEARRG